VKDANDSNTSADVLDKKAKKELMLKKMSRELIRGSVMLQESCPVCNTPLIQRKDSEQIYCLSCDKKVIREKDLDRKKENGRAYYSQQKPEAEYIEKLLAMVAGKLESQLFKIAEEENLEELEKKLEIADQLVNLMKSLKEIQRA